MDRPAHWFAGILRLVVVEPARVVQLSQVGRWELLVHCRWGWA